MSFADQLTVVLEDRPPTQSPLEAATEIIHSMDSLKQQFIDLQHRLGSIKQRMNADLALGVRRNHPGLNVSVDPTGCKVGYRSKSLNFDPDIEKGVWIVAGEDPRFMGRFKRQFGRSTVLLPDIAPLVSAITDYFTGHYKSLGEDIVGNGVVLIEGKRASLRELVGYGDFQPAKKLNTRLARRVG
jgi:hypothetical protein